MNHLMCDKPLQLTTWEKHFNVLFQIDDISAKVCYEDYLRVQRQKFWFTKICPSYTSRNKIKSFCTSFTVDNTTTTDKHNRLKNMKMNYFKTLFLNFFFDASIIGVHVH